MRHAFEGRVDQPCTACGKPDRHSGHTQAPHGVAQPLSVQPYTRPTKYDRLMHALVECQRLTRLRKQRESQAKPPQDHPATHAHAVAGLAVEIQKNFEKKLTVECTCGWLVELPYEDER